MSGRIQLGGNIQFGPAPGSLVSYSNDISSVVLNRRRPGQTKPATFGEPETTQKAGADEYQLTVNFFHDEGDVANFWAGVWDAMDTDAGELYFEATLKPGTVSATNPKFTGYVVLVDLDTGGTVGQWKQQGKTWPARAVAGPITTP
jgi:hypothetical protein